MHQVFFVVLWTAVFGFEKWRIDQDLVFYPPQVLVQELVYLAVMGLKPREETIYFDMAADLGLNRQLH